MMWKVIVCLTCKVRVASVSSILKPGSLAHYLHIRCSRQCPEGHVCAQAAGQRHWDNERDHFSRDVLAQESFGGHSSSSSLCLVMKLEKFVSVTVLFALLCAAFAFALLSWALELGGERNGQTYPLYLDFESSQEAKGKGGSDWIRSYHFYRIFYQVSVQFWGSSGKDKISDFGWLLHIDWLCLNNNLLLITHKRSTTFAKSWGRGEILLFFLLHCLLSSVWVHAILQ